MFKRYLGAPGSPLKARLRQTLIGVEDAGKGTHVFYSLSGGAGSWVPLPTLNNLTNTAYETYSGTRDRQLEYQKWGRTVQLGANYKF